MEFIENHWTEDHQKEIKKKFFRYNKLRRGLCKKIDSEFSEWELNHFTNSVCKVRLRVIGQRCGKCYLCVSSFKFEFEEYKKTPKRKLNRVPKIDIWSDDVIRYEAIEGRGSIKVPYSVSTTKKMNKACELASCNFKSLI